MLNKRKLGNKYEDYAVEVLCSKGFNIIARNYYYKGGEIDIIASKKDIIYFFEVKFRSKNTYGYATESLTNRKIFNIRKGIYKFLTQSKIKYNGIEIYLMAFDDDKMTIIPIA